MLIGILIFASGVWAADPPQVPSEEPSFNQPRAITDAAIVEESIKDEDLKQAAEWMEKSDSVEKAKTVENTDAKIDASALPVKENQIPVLGNHEEKKAIKQESPVKKAAASMGIVLGMMIGGFIFFKKWSQKQSKNNKNTQIKVLTQHFLGPRKSLAIIRVAGESILVGITEQNITMIKSLALLDDDIPGDTPAHFSKSLDKAQANSNVHVKATDTDQEDEFSLTKIKDFVSDRLKGMKEI